MADKDDFPGRSVIASFNLVERMLADVLHVIPYAPEHEGVWSPTLATILLEACSQLDSLWKHEAQHFPPDGLPVTGNQTIVQHFQHFGKGVAGRWVVLWGEKGERLEPFSQWAGAPDYHQSSYEPEDWWQAYNDVKHDRLAHRKRATLRNAAHALAGLFLGILRCPACAEFVVQEGWVISKPHDPDPSVLLGDNSPIISLAAESNLLSHIMWWDRYPGGGMFTIDRRASFRLVRWVREEKPVFKYLL